MSEKRIYIERTYETRITASSDEELLRKIGQVGSEIRERFADFPRLQLGNNGGSSASQMKRPLTAIKPMKPIQPIQRKSISPMGEFPKMEFPEFPKFPDFDS